MKYAKLISAILIFIMLGCNFSVNPGKNNESKNIIGDFSGIAIYVGPLDSVRFGAKGTRVGAYQNDQEIAYTTITSENGAFQLQGLKTGLYDLVFTTDQMYQQTYHYHPGKIADFTIYSGENSLPDTVTMPVIYPEENASDGWIVVKFKETVTLEESQYIIDQSGCSISFRFLENGFFYVLEIPQEELEHKIVEWFLKRTKVWWASVHPIMPLDIPNK
jgi:hypothetical protein